MPYVEAEEAEGADLIKPVALLDVPAAQKESLLAPIKRALRDPAFIFVASAFVTCGFHVALVSTHLPGEVTPL